MKTQLMERIGEASGKATVGIGAVSALWGWLTVEQMFSALGVLIGLLGLAVTWYYKRAANRRNDREAKLREELLQARIEALRRSGRHVMGDSDLGKLGVPGDEL